MLFYAILFLVDLLGGLMAYPGISITLPEEVLEIVDQFRAKKFLKRSPAIVQIILEWYQFKEVAAKVEGGTKDEH
jgi:metal-responsive CopG/Arc/MetJ family transcriptional regulator